MQLILSLAQKERKYNDFCLFFQTDRVVQNGYKMLHRPVSCVFVTYIGRRSTNEASLEENFITLMIFPSDASSSQAIPDLRRSHYSDITCEV